MAWRRWMPCQRSTSSSRSSASSCIRTRRSPSATCTAWWTTRRAKPMPRAYNDAITLHTHIQSSGACGVQAHVRSIARLRRVIRLNAEERLVYQTIEEGGRKGTTYMMITRALSRRGVSDASRRRWQVPGRVISEARPVCRRRGSTRSSRRSRTSDSSSRPSGPSSHASASTCCTNCARSSASSIIPRRASSIRL